MFNSEALEVGIAMAFLFLLMSLICTGIKEWMEGIFKWRAMDLERALRTLLNDEGGQLTAQVFMHPLISSLFQGRYDPGKLTKSSLTSWLTGGANAKHMPLSARRHLPSYIPAAQFACAVIDLVWRGPAVGEAETAPSGSLNVEQLRERAAALTSPFLRRSLLSAIDHCEGDLKQLRLYLQQWFDGSMDRASGWYKRRTQAVLFMLGLGAAAVLNVDALYVMGRLTSDKTFRETVVVAAAPAPAASGADPLDTAHRARLALEDVGMPIGWRDVEGALFGIQGVQRCKAEVADTCKATAGYAPLRMLAGWLVTAFAVMLGAPFWFDVLNKFMVIRSTVKPHEKSRDEGSEDRTDTPDSNAPGAGGAPAAVRAPPADGGAVGQPTPAPTHAAPVFVPHEWRDGIVNPNEVPL